MCSGLKIPPQNQVIMALALYLSGRSPMVEIGEKELEKKLTEMRQSQKDIELPEKILE